MSGLPSTQDSLLVRTDFTDERAWQTARAAALAENGDGFRAYVQVIDDPQFADCTWQSLRQEVAALEDHAAVLFVVDGPALTDDHPILVVDLSDQLRAAFRCVAHELWGVDNNLSISNMDWEEFADNVDGGGVFRGFP
jgi:hypothetical protein